MDNHTAHIPPSPAQTEHYHQERRAGFVRQQDAAQKADLDKREKMADFYAADILRRQAEKAAKLKLKNAAAVASGLEIHIPESPIPSVPAGAKPQERQERVASSSSKYGYQITIVPSSSHLPWFSPSSPEHQYTTLESARQAGIWLYPETPAETSRCRVFEDLWYRGYFMGVGLRFGGDFLVYPGRLAFRSASKPEP